MIKRYNIDADMYSNFDFVEREDGEWVKYEDVEKFKNAVIHLIFLHNCEMEGLASIRPDTWILAVEDVELAMKW